MPEKFSQNFYITTTLPYVNSDPHVGFAAEIVRADVVARYKKLIGYEVFFNTGTDEHGQKIFDKAKEQGVETQKYVDKYSKKFKGLVELLGLLPEIHFIRTTDAHHVVAAQEFWRRCEKAGDIYKKAYKIKYCVGCELEKTDSELVDGHCLIHPNLEIEIREEENYFFKFSKYQKKLLDLYEKTEREDRPLVVPATRFNEIKAFVSRGLEDFSISRLASKMSWGVPVPGDDTQVMYVWFDALVNYISTLGWPENTAQFEKFWQNGTPVQYCGKDNLRQQSAMWQAMLMSAGLPLTNTIVIDGFITGAGGAKMSKSAGNVINPYDVVAEYGTDALRYFVLRELSPFEDSPFTMEQFKQSYNANLANGIGNLTSRILKMYVSYDLDTPNIEGIRLFMKDAVPDSYWKSLDDFNIKEATDHIWKRIQWLDEYIQKTEPFKKIKTDQVEAKKIIAELLEKLWIIGFLLQPILPATASVIMKCIEEKKKPEKPLFMRKD